MLPRGSKDLSSSAPEASVAPHGSPRLPQELPQRPSRELKRPPRAPPSAPEVPKRPPRAVQIAARERLGLLRQPQVPPRGHWDSQKRLLLLLLSGAKSPHRSGRKNHGCLKHIIYLTNRPHWRCILHDMIFETS